MYYHYHAYAIHTSYICVGSVGCDVMRNLNYRILLRKEPEGGYTVTVPTLPGCVTYGETVDEAIEMAREAIELYIEHLQEKGEEIPTEEGLLEYTLTVEAHA